LRDPSGIAHTVTESNEQSCSLPSQALMPLESFTGSPVRAASANFSASFAARAAKNSSTALVAVGAQNSVFR